MAIVKYGSIVTELKGKLSGIVFQKCGSVLSVRVNQSKLRTKSPIGFKWRAQFGSMASSWRFLTSTQRATWVSNAPSWPATDGFGNPQKLTGYSLYILVNSFRALKNLSFFSTIGAYSPPANTGGELDYYSLTTQTAPYLADITVPNNHYQYWFVSDPYNAERYVSHPKYFFAFTLSSGVTVGTNLYNSINNNLRIKPSLGQLLYIKTYLYNNLTGQFILTQAFSVIVT